VNGVIDEQGVSIHRARKIVCMSRSMYYYDHRKDDQIVISHPHKSLNGLSPWLYAKNPLVS